MILAILLALQDQSNPFDQWPGKVIAPACLSGAKDCAPWERGPWEEAQPEETDFIELSTASNGAVWLIQNLALVAAAKTKSQEPKVWIKVDFRAVKTERARYGSYLLKVDCLSQRVATLHATRYAPSGDTLSNYDVPDYAARSENIVPGTLYSIVARAVCPRLS